jgi:WD40 repeat protein
MPGSARHPPSAQTELLRSWGSYDLLIKGSVSQLLYANGGKEILALQDDRTLRGWDLSSSSPPSHFPNGNVCRVPDVGLTGGGYCPPRSCSLEPPLALLANQEMAATVNESGVTLCDLSGTGNTRHVAAPSPTAPANVAGVSEDGTRLVAGNDDGSLTLYRLDGTGPTKKVQVHTGPVVAVATSFDGKRAVSVGADGRVVPIDPTSGKAGSPQPLLAKHNGKGPCGEERIVAAAVSPDLSRARAGHAPTGLVDLREPGGARAPLQRGRSAALGHRGLAGERGRLLSRQQGGRAGGRGPPRGR